MPMLRILSILILTAATAILSEAQTFKWYNPEEADFRVIQGQAFPDDEREGYYHRIPSRFQSQLRRSVWRLGKQTAGESIQFNTNSSEIRIRYKVNRNIAMPHMPATGVSGLDLYTRDECGNEVWLTPKYSFKDTISYVYAPIDRKRARLADKYTLFLPLYNEVEWLEIGVAQDAEFQFEKPSSKKPIVAYGTSICQGACASRPAMAWTNILRRRLDWPIINLGFSGNAMHEKEVIGLLAEIDAAVYILDGLPNSYRIPAPELRDTIVTAVRQLRQQRPDTPIILVDHSGYPQSKVYKVYKDRQEHAIRSLEDAYKMLRKEGVKGLHYLKYDDIGMVEEMMVEGIHMSDYGMTTYANAYEKILRKILK